MDAVQSAITDPIVLGVTEANFSFVVVEPPSPFTTPPHPTPAHRDLVGHVTSTTHVVNESTAGVYLRCPARPDQLHRYQDKCLAITDAGPARYC